MASHMFASGVLSPAQGEDSNSSLEKSGDGMWKTSSFYLDSSGRSRIHCNMLQLKFPSKDVLNAILATKCLSHLTPEKEEASSSSSSSSSNAVNENDGENSKQQEATSSSGGDDNSGSSPPPPSPPSEAAAAVRYSLGIEAKVTLTFGTGEAIAAQVESVTIQSYSIDVVESCLYFNTEINLHVARKREATSTNNTDTVVTPAVTSATSSSSCALSALQGVVAGVKLNIEIAAVLWEKFTNFNGDSQVSKGLRNLYVGRLSRGGAGGGSAGSGGLYKNMAAAHRQALQTRASPFSLQVALTQALSISARSIPGPTNNNNNMNETLVSLTIRHSNTHSQHLAITNIALHPAFSHETTMSRSTMTNEGKKSSVIDMSKSVHWGFAPKSEAKLPLILGPHEAYSTVLTIKSLGGSKCQTFSSPVSVTAVVVSKTNSSNISSTGGGGSSSADVSSTGGGGHGSSSRAKNKDKVVAQVNVAWTSGASAVERSDAFRVNMSLPQEGCTVGSAFALSLEVFNLSTDLRNMNLVLAKPNSKSTNNTISANQQQNKSGDEDKDRTILAGMTIKDDSYREELLLAIDDSLSLGEFRGLSCNKAEVRFVPLRAGTLKLPNFGLVDNNSGKLYQCIHSLQVVARE